MTQDNLTVEKIQEFWDTPTGETDYYHSRSAIMAQKAIAITHIDFLLKQVESLKINKGGKTNFDEVVELKRQLKSLDGVVKQHEKRIYDLSEELRQAYEQVESQDEITAALHIVNAELGRRVESQKEVATKYHELLYQVAEKCPNETRHETALRYIKRAEEPSNCCAGGDQLPKDE